MKLTLFVGPPGSGKSTMARAMFDSADTVFGTTYINQDEQGRERHLELFKDAISEGRPIIVDRMGFNREQRNRYLNPAKAAGYETEIIILHQPYNVCLERVRARKDHETIKDENAARGALGLFFSKYERVQDEEADKITRIWPEGDKPDAVWIDIDNTLSDASHREHYLQGSKKNWKGFFSEMSNDPVNNWCRMLAIGMKGCSHVLICSARPDNYRKQTEEWLAFNDVPYDKLIMRQRNDSRKDSIVKEIIYEFEVKTQYNLLFSVDDRKQVIDQIRTHGVTVLDCAGEKGHF